APVATDNCDPSVQIGENDTYLAGSCPQEQILIREWTATDACGNSATVSRTIIIQDREEPVISRSEEHTSELQSRENLVCRLLLVLAPILGLFPYTTLFRSCACCY